MAKAKSTSVKKNVRTKRPSAPVKVSMTEISATDIPVVASPVVPELKVIESKPIIPVVSQPVAPKPIAPKVTTQPIPVIDSKESPFQVEIVANKDQSGRGMVIGVIGGSVVGYLAYTTLKPLFLNRGLTKDKSDQYAMLSAVACGLLTVGLIYKMNKA